MSESGECNPGVTREGLERTGRAALVEEVRRLSAMLLGAGAARLRVMQRRELRERREAWRAFRGSEADRVRAASRYIEELELAVEVLMGDRIARVYDAAGRLLSEHLVTDGEGGRLEFDPPRVEIPPGGHMSVVLRPGPGEAP